MVTVEQHQMAYLLDQMSVPTDLPWHLHLHRLLCTTTKEKPSVVPMLHTPTPRSIVLFGVAFNSSATETSVLSSLRQLRTECHLVPEYLPTETQEQLLMEPLLDLGSLPTDHQ